MIVITISRPRREDGVYLTDTNVSGRDTPYLRTRSGSRLWSGVVWWTNQRGKEPPVSTDWPDPVGRLDGDPHAAAYDGESDIATGGAQIHTS